MARAVLVDSGAWIALLSRNDDLHLAASRHYDELSRAGTRLLTTNYVTDETATRLRYGLGLQAALSFHTMIDTAMGQRRLRVVWIDEDTEREGWQILEKYADVKLSLTDAVSAAVAHRSRVSQLFAFDQDFAALGFVVAPRT